ncbi:MAG: GntR family transcriptional regulator [Proteobacteria bacterium]|nr:MAG: GntR family transcriptional regulator [Pseudomonadota bacterium]
MQLKPIKPSKISDAISEQLKELIRNGALKPGDRLPSERELVEQLGVSRPSVREALLKLEAKGLVTSRQGGGTFVSDVLAPSIVNPLADLMRDNPEAVSDVLECRHGLEELAASYAALRATASDREIIHEKFRALAEASESRDLERSATADSEFHMAIAEASHNFALIHITRSLFDLLSTQMLSNWEHLLTNPESCEQIHDQHQYIFEAIISGDPDMARNAAHTHLSYIGRCLKDITERNNRNASSLLRHARVDNGGFK